jgi:hypothetical protein
LADRERSSCCWDCPVRPPQAHTPTERMLSLSPARSTRNGRVASAAMREFRNHARLSHKGRPLEELTIARCASLRRGPVRPSRGDRPPCRPDSTSGEIEPLLSATTKDHSAGFVRQPRVNSIAGRFAPSPTLGGEQRRRCDCCSLDGRAAAAACVPQGADIVAAPVAAQVEGLGSTTGVACVLRNRRSQVRILTGAYPRNPATAGFSHA